MYLSMDMPHLSLLSSAEWLQSADWQSEGPNVPKPCPGPGTSGWPNRKRKYTVGPFQRFSVMSLQFCGELCCDPCFIQTLERATLFKVERASRLCAKRKDSTVSEPEVRSFIIIKNKECWSGRKFACLTSDTLTHWPTQTRFSWLIFLTHTISNFWLKNKNKTSATTYKYFCNYRI